MAHTGLAYWQGSDLHLLHAPLVGRSVEVSTGAPGGEDSEASGGRMGSGWYGLWIRGVGRGEARFRDLADVGTVGLGSGPGRVLVFALDRMALRMIRPPFKPIRKKVSDLPFRRRPSPFPRVARALAGGSSGPNRRRQRWTGAGSGPWMGVQPRNHGPTGRAPPEGGLPGSPFRRPAPRRRAAALLTSRRDISGTTSWRPSGRRRRAFLGGLGS